MRELCHNCGSQSGNKAEYTVKSGEKICRSCQKYHLIENEIQIRELIRRAKSHVDSPLQLDFSQLQYSF